MKNSNIKQINERLLAYQCIYEIFYRDAYANLSLQKIFKSHKLLSRDKALITAENAIISNILLKN